MRARIPRSPLGASGSGELSITGGRRRTMPVELVAPVVGRGIAAEWQAKTSGWRPAGRLFAAAQGQALHLGRSGLCDDRIVAPLAGTCGRPITARDAFGLGQIDGPAALGCDCCASAGIQLMRSGCRYDSPLGEPREMDWSWPVAADGIQRLQAAFAQCPEPLQPSFRVPGAPVVAGQHREVTVA
jgi:hypothetical protein